MSTISENTITRIWNQTVHYTTYKTYGLDLSKTAEDIAAEAIEYALKNKDVTWDDTAASHKHLSASAKKVAMWTIRKEIQKIKRAKVSYELDTLAEEADEKSLEISKAESDHVKMLHHEKREHDEMKEIGRLALSRLDGFLARKGVSPRDICIYKDRALYTMPTDIVCKKHSIKPSNLYKIVSVINSILATKGHTLIRE